MIKKFMPGVVAALIMLASLLGSSGQAFAATGGTSLSTLVYAEQSELTTSILDWGVITDPAKNVEAWLKIDSYLKGQLQDTSSYQIWHVFGRTMIYDLAGNVTDASDGHEFVKVLVPSTTVVNPVRENGTLYFKDSTGSNKAYQMLLKDNYGGLSFQTATLTGLYSSTVSGTQILNTITIIKKMDATTAYNPANPPPYGIPGWTDPKSWSTGYDPNNPPGSGGGNNPTDPDFPVQPTPPDDNWDLIGWVKYVVDWFIYVIKCFVYFLKSFGTAIADVVTGSASLISALTDFLAFLPNQITTIIGMGIVAMIIVGVVKR